MYDVVVNGADVVASTPKMTCWFSEADPGVDLALVWYIGGEKDDGPVWFLIFRALGR